MRCQTSSVPAARRNVLAEKGFSKLISFHSQMPLTAQVLPNVNSHCHLVTAGELTASGNLASLGSIARDVGREETIQPQRP